ncbi:hypothetical protein HZH66_000629 [Vespula vulgaris]|uniref:Uncharacterized protein n=1 Tax=Vespula vulgaris TaxID=7454 RepID=A0A834KRN1_VESVU|nr:hypothetical protein HZH66_000629 [Vespula vulgaris]
MVHSEKYGKVVPPSKEENMGLVNKDTWSYQIWMGTIEICTWFSQKARISTLFEESSEFQGGKPEFVEAVPY